MISFSKILRGIRAILGLVEEVEEVIPLTQPSRQLSPEDVRRQQSQIQSAVSYKVPAPSSKPKR